jgi:hypothetical protein
MKTYQYLKSKADWNAFARIIVYSVIVYTLVAAIAPAFKKARVGSGGPSCQTRLKQIGTCFRAHAADEGGFPMQLPNSIAPVN